MIDEDKQDRAVEYAFGMLDSAAERAFEAELKADEELRVFAMELRESAAALAHDAPALLPPPELRERILQPIRGELAVAAAAAAASPIKPQAPKETSSFGFLPWAIAAGLAITSVGLWTELRASREEALFLRTEASDLRKRDEFSQMKIATLTAQNEAYAKAGAVVVWDGAKQRGVVKLSNFPPVASGKDYQLWLIDSKKGGPPVSGGVVPVNADGVARVSFEPGHPVGKPDKFAISVEKEGGVPEVAGPVILAGD